MDFYGFKNHSEKESLYEINNEKIDIRKVIEFFKEHEIETVLCDQTKKFINLAKEKEYEFIKNINFLNEIKNNPAGKDFNDFCNFTETLNRKLKDITEYNYRHLTEEMTSEDGLKIFKSSEFNFKL